MPILDKKNELTAFKKNELTALLINSSKNKQEPSFPSFSWWTIFLLPWPMQPHQKWGVEEQCQRAQSLSL